MTTSQTNSGDSSTETLKHHQTKLVMHQQKARRRTTTTVIYIIIHPGSLKDGVLKGVVISSGRYTQVNTDYRLFITA